MLGSFGYMVVSISEIMENRFWYSCHATKAGRIPKVQFMGGGVFLYSVRLACLSFPVGRPRVTLRWLSVLCLAPGCNPSSQLGPSAFNYTPHVLILHLEWINFTLPCIKKPGSCLRCEVFVVFRTSEVDMRSTGLITLPNYV